MDDNKVIRQLIRVNLELEGFEVVTAGDGVECLEVVHQVRPDAVTLDVVMPRLDGLRTAARLRADPRTRDLPIAIVSACTQYEVDAGFAAGADAFPSKPFEPPSSSVSYGSWSSGRSAVPSSTGRPDRAPGPGPRCRGCAGSRARTGRPLRRERKGGDLRIPQPASISRDCRKSVRPPTPLLHTLVP
ncbi:Protein-glutamate methylesterase/protein-glutamine glutaminase [Streptomyces violaceorubidus]